MVESLLRVSTSSPRIRHTIYLESNQTFPEIHVPAPLTLKLATVFNFKLSGLQKRVITKKNLTISPCTPSSTTLLQGQLTVVGKHKTSGIHEGTCHTSEAPRPFYTYSSSFRAHLKEHIV